MDRYRKHLVMATMAAACIGCGSGQSASPARPLPSTSINSAAGSSSVAAAAAGASVAGDGSPRWTEPFCSASGWCWDNPLPQGSGLHDLWGAAADDVFAVGAAGTVLHYDGRHWRPQESTSGESLRAVWGSGPNDVYATGEQATVLHYDGTRWRRLIDSPLRGINHVKDFASVGSGAAVAVGHGGAFRFDGQRWSQLPRPPWTTSPFALEGVWTGGPDVAVAVGFNGEAWHFDGRRWSMQPTSSDRTLRAVAGRAATDLLAVGEGDLLRYDGSGWSIDGTSSHELLDVWASKAGYVAVGRKGAILAVEGNSWKEQPSGIDDGRDLEAVWGADKSRVLAVGDGGRLLAFDGARWSEHSRGLRHHLNAVWGSSPDDVVAVGYEGIILRRDGDRWVEQASETQSDLWALWGSGPDDVFAVGAGGTVIHFDGEHWSPQRSGSAATLKATWGSAPDDVWAVGASGTILRYDGTRWSAQPSPTTHELRGIWGSGAGDVYAVGVEGTVVHFDGKRWSTIASGTKRHLSGVWASGPDDVHVVGAAWLHFDGKKWTTREAGEPVGAAAIWGTGPKDVYAVGPWGSVEHFDGQRWVTDVTHCELNLQSVSGSGSGSGSGVVYVVGNAGTVLRRSGARKSATPPSTASGTSGSGIHLDLASHCQGDPYTANWITMQADADVPATPQPNTCYLPGWRDSVQLDLFNMRGCMQDKPTRLQTAMQLPATFFVRASGAVTGLQTLHVRARTERGQPCGGFCSEGWDGWRSLFHDRVWDGRVIPLPRKVLLGQAKHHVELWLQVRDAAGQLLAERLISIHWPVSC